MQAGDGELPPGDGASWNGEGRRVRRGLDAVVSASLRPIALSLALLYALFAMGHLRFLSGAERAVMAPVAVTTSLLFFFLGWLVRRHPPRPGWAHPLGVFFSGLVLLNSLLHLGVTGDPIQTTNLLLLILGVGVLFLDAAWFAVVIGSTFAGWFLVLTRVPPHPHWVHFTFSLVGATLLASAVLAIRVRAYRRVEELRFRDRVRQLELESALTRVEEALRGEEDARLALEGAVAQLRESEERFRRLADASSEGVLIHQGGRVVDANRRAAELFGRSLPEVLGAEVAGLIRTAPPDSRLGALKSTSGEASLEGVRKDGTAFPVERATLATAFENRPAEVTVFRDVTEARELERALRRAAEEAEGNSRAKSAFLANMSHELRTPLNAIIGFANLMGKNAGGNLSPREVDFVQRISSNGAHLLHLINEVLDLSKVEAQRMEVTPQPVDLAVELPGIVRGLEIQARKKGLDLRAVVPDGLPPLVADPHRLRQVLINLVGNAVKFTAEGWVEIRVVAGGDPPRPLRIEVEDTGIGIPEDQVERVFSPFQQVDSSHARAFGGTGLGLAISRSLCELMGFTLTAVSRPGQGSTFVVGVEVE